MGPDHVFAVAHLTVDTAHNVSFLIFWSASLAGVSGEEPAAHHEFMAQPFGQSISEEVKLGSYSCKFTYKCVGGTGESWEMKLLKHGSEYHCVIQRPEQSSYLFFMEFSASFHGGKLTRAEPYDNTRRMLHEDEYSIEGNTVKNSKGFKANLAT